jgi:hypothetical protein
MFRFSDATEKLLMWIGTIAAIAAGTVMPLFSFVFGEVALIYGKDDPIG